MIPTSHIVSGGNTGNVGGIGGKRDTENFIEKKKNSITGGSAKTQKI